LGISEFPAGRVARCIDGPYSIAIEGGKTLLQARRRAEGAERMNANPPIRGRRSALAVFATAFAVTVGFAHAAEGPLEGEWGGLDARGATAQVMVTSSKILGFFWGGDYRETGSAKVYDGGARIEFTFARGAASLVKTAAGARLTIREVGRSPNPIDLKKD
jgi:hypothetical protein